jgi:hypothetical protein
VKTKLPHEIPGFPERVSGATRRVFIRIAEVWSLSDTEQVDLLVLDDLAALEHFRQPSDEALSIDVLFRVSYVLGIYRALRILLPSDERANGWIKQPNTNALFGGKPVLALMTTRKLTDLAKVRRYLDAQIDPDWG